MKNYINTYGITEKYHFYVRKIMVLNPKIDRISAILYLARL